MTHKRQASLAQQNQQYAGTNGVSQNNASLGMVPAFQDADTGRIEISRLPNGEPAPMHLITTLPPEWVTEDGDRHCLILKANITPGFVKDGIFYTREEAARYNPATDNR